MAIPAIDDCNMSVDLLRTGDNDLCTNQRTAFTAAPETETKAENMTSETRNTNFFKPSIIDVESSGLGPESYPIEIGVALSSGEQYCSLILPASSWTTWDRHSEMIHGISLEEIMTSGKPIGDVTRELNRLLENRTVYTDGWVVDQRWISQLYYEASIPKQFTVSSLESILSEGQMNIWHETKNHVMTELGLKRHRASADALIIQETYVRTRRLAE